MLGRFVDIGALSFAVVLHFGELAVGDREDSYSAIGSPEMSMIRLVTRDGDLADGADVYALGLSTEQR